MIIRELLVKFGIVVEGESPDTFAKRVDAAKGRLEAAAASADKARGAIADLVGWWAKGATAIAGVGAGLVYLTDQTAQYALAVERQADALGMTTDEYQEIRKVFEAFGVDQRDIADLFAQAAQQSVAAQNGAQSIADAFGALGISTDALAKAGPVELLELIADGASKTGDPVKRLAAVSTLLGEDLTKKLAPLLNKGAKGIQAFREEVRKSGAVIGKDGLEAASKYRETMFSIGLALEGVRSELGGALLPVVAETAGAFLDFVKANRETISAGIDEFAKRVGDEFARMKVLVVDVDREVRSRFGGWGPVLETVAKGAASASAAFAAFKVGSALYFGLDAIYGLIMAVGAALGVGFLPAVGAIALLTAGVVAQFAPLFAIAALWYDVFQYFNGGASYVGAFLDQWRGAPGIMGEVVRVVEALVRILGALGSIAASIAGVFVDTFLGAVDLVTNGIKGWIALFEYLLGVQLPGIASWVGLLASGLEALAGGLEGVAGLNVSSGITQGAGAALGSLPGGANFRPTATPGGAGGSSTTNNTSIGGNTYQISGTDPTAIANEIGRRDAAQRRAALQGLTLGADQ